MADLPESEVLDVGVGVDASLCNEAHQAAVARVVGELAVGHAPARTRLVARRLRAGHGVADDGGAPSAVHPINAGVRRRQLATIHQQPRRKAFTRERTVSRVVENNSCAANLDRSHRLPEDIALQAAIAQLDAVPTPRDEDAPRNVAPRVALAVNHRQHVARPTNNLTQRDKARLVGAAVLGTYTLHDHVAAGSCDEEESQLAESHRTEAPIPVVVVDASEQDAWICGAGGDSRA